MSFRFQRASSFNFSQYRGNGGGRVLQRRCACGNRAESGGECSQCAESERSLQRKARSGGPFEAPPIVDDVLRSPGQPLDSESRGFMEERFGYDFSSVRVHADPQAQRSADETNADAYTVGQNIVFASGRYAPQTPAGQELLAHELTHVVQQRSAPSSGPIEMGERDEHEVSADQTAAEVVSGSGPVPALNSASVSLQRQEATEEGAKSGGAAPPCLEHVVGEDIGALMESGALTIIEFGATWCEPCKQLKADLNSICEKFGKQPPPVTVRFYSIDIDVEGNEKVSEPYVSGGVPHLYFFVGSSEQSHYASAPQFDVLEKIVADHVEYASTSGAARGAFKGMGWGSLAGGLAGIAGGIALGSHFNLEGNEMMGAALGGGAIGAAVGLGLGAAIGGIVGHAKDDRKTGPEKQKRRKLQKRSKDDEQKRKKEDVQTSSAQKKSEEVSLPWSRGEKTAASTGIGAAGGALLGLGLGVGIAATMKDTPYGAGAGWGALIGGLAGGLGGLLYGLFARNTDQESQEVADAVIRRRYGKYLRDASAGPLHNAKVNTVSRAEICERKACRTCVPSPAVDCTAPGSPKDCAPKAAEDCTKPKYDPDCGLIGWADSGPAIKPSLGPGGAQPAPLANAAAEPTCGGRQMDHATTASPVIYYAQDAPGGTMIHEGLHAWSHPDFGFLHNHVNEGTTEYFTRRLQDDINMPHYGSYDDEYKNVQKLVGLVGEEKLARAYFGGQVAELHQAVNSQLGDCALITWAFALQQFSFGFADQIMEGRNNDYCKSKRFRDVTPGELTPPPPNKEQTHQR
jgi:thiol-disulfide isomerase/thioredoxin